MGQTTRADDLLSRHRAGDESARPGLVALAQERFVVLARAMLRNYAHVRRWEDTDDLLQAALLRLDQSLSEVRPGTVAHFDNLAATQIRRALIDLARHYYGPEGEGAKHHTDGQQPEQRLLKIPDRSGRPETLDAWAMFHEAVERLPDAEREVFNLLWYQGLTHAQAAEALGVTTKTIQRRWIAARLALRDALHGESPATD
jgi:RNA polymerase sigma-70 factor (ECF subfamily)